VSTCSIYSREYASTRASTRAHVRVSVNTQRKTCPRDYSRQCETGLTADNKVHRRKNNTTTMFDWFTYNNNNSQAMSIYNIHRLTTKIYIYMHQQHKKI